MNFRIEKDSLGEVKVAEDVLWGAQTQRSFQNFPQNAELMPLSVIMALVKLKKAAAIANFNRGKLDENKKTIIVKAADEILAEKYNDQFPLTVWQTGSGTQSNMNVNEVITHIANMMQKEEIIHPNDHVNMSQSSNDTFPSAMHISALISLTNNLFPAIENILSDFKRLEDENNDIVMTGRTHMQDATPVKLSQVISGFRVMLERDYMAIKESGNELKNLAIGGTAVGTGLNCPEGFDEEICKEISKLTGIEFKPDDNKFYQLSSKSALVNVHSAIKTFATDLYKIASDIRLLSCGPRCGIGEIIIPSNEPGSSIMPGKVNPTQIESTTMICIQIMANDTAISMANTQGQMQLNAYMPLIIYNMDQSISLLSKTLNCFSKNLLDGLKPNREKIQHNLNNSLMLVTGLSPYIGYDKSSEIAKNAYNKSTTLKESAIELGYLSEEEFEKYVKPEDMV